jgi:hypothetical protein
MRPCDCCGKPFRRESNSQRHCSVLCRFWSKALLAADDKCWEWSAGSNGQGYGVFRLTTSVNVLAPRMAWMLCRGDIGDLDVCHNCDNPACVNPAHLFLGTHQENMSDMKAKGRVRKGDPAKARNRRFASLAEYWASMRGVKRGPRRPKG